MIRITKQADYGILFLTRIARDPEREVFTARDLAEEFHIGVPMVSKVLKLLTRGSVLRSQRGIKGGYSLARSPGEITVSEIVAALDGPIAITECAGSQPTDCRTEPYCAVAEPWQRINQAIVEALNGITLEQMCGEAGCRVPAIPELSARRDGDPSPTPTMNV